MKTKDITRLIPDKKDKHMNTTKTPHLTAVLVAPLAAAGILLGTVAVGGSPTAVAQPAGDDQCSGMAMTNG